MKKRIVFLVLFLLIAGYCASTLLKLNTFAVRNEKRIDLSPPDILLTKIFFIVSLMGLIITLISYKVPLDRLFVYLKKLKKKELKKKIKN